MAASTWPDAPKFLDILKWRDARRFIVATIEESATFGQMEEKFKELYNIEVGARYLIE